MTARGRMIGFVLSGVGTVTGFYISGVIDLVGSTTQIPYVISGIVLGGIIFGLSSILLAKKVQHAIIPSAIVAAALLLLDATYVSTRPLASNFEMLMLSFFACSLLLPVGSVVFKVPRFMDGSFLVSGSIFFLIVSAVVYIEDGYSGLGMIALVNVGVGFAAVLLSISLPARRMQKGDVRTKQVAVLGGLLILVVSSALGTPLAIHAQTTTPIKHVVEIMMENHSFDNVFGVYPGPSNPLGLQVPHNLLGSAALSSLQPVPTGSFSTKDPVEGYIAYHEDWNGGSMNGFEKGSGSPSLLYYTSAQYGEEWALAEQYSLGDMYFANQLSETSPNRLFSLAGYSPVINDYGPPPYVPVQQSIFSELSHYGVSWGYYVQNPSEGVGTLDYFYGMGQYAGNIKSWNDFFSELSAGMLPSVSWMMPVDGGAVGYSQGPPSNVLQGELWLMYVVNKIESSPEWNSTAIFITYDEGGGFYDQVSPPTVSGVQMGERVPLIVVSPYSKENYVSNTVMTHTSILAFIDYNWGLPPLNRLVAESNLPLDMFDFNQSYPGGGLARPPIHFNGLPLPDSAVFSLAQFSNLTNLSDLFPMQPQVPFSQLPYSREGSSNVSLGVAAGVYVTEDTGFVPFYEAAYFIGMLYVVLLALCAMKIDIRQG